MKGENLVGKRAAILVITAVSSWTEYNIASLAAAVSRRRRAVDRARLAGGLSGVSSVHILRRSGSPRRPLSPIILFARLE
jgi:hypothetical protein